MHINLHLRKPNNFLFFYHFYYKSRRMPEEPAIDLSPDMDLIHRLSSIEIKTTHSSSQEAEEKEEEMKRNWVELPPDVLSLIFLKLGAANILSTAQWVCSSWWKLSKQPHLFRSFHVEQVFTLFGSTVLLDFIHKLWEELAREAIDRSCGQLVEFSVRGIPNDGFLQYMSEKLSSLRCLRLVNDGDFVTYDVFIEIAKRLPHLEELEIIQCLGFPRDMFRCLCPSLRRCRCNLVSYYWNETEFHRVALAIAENMPELCHLNLFGNNVTDDDLRAILDGCPHLEYLDLRQCFDLEFAGDLKERCGNIKVLRHPSDTSVDFKYYTHECCPVHDDSDSDDSCI